MSALCEEAVVCNYRCFSSLLAKTTNKCSSVTWQRVTEKPLLVSLFVCVLEITWLTLFCLTPSSFLRASSAFEVAMWKSLATNPNKYNNRAISSLSQRCFSFFFSCSCQGGAEFCERRPWSRASLPFPFPELFLFVDLHAFYRRLFPLFLHLSCGVGSVSHHSLWWNHKKAQAHVTRVQQLLGDRERGVSWGLDMF